MTVMDFAVFGVLVFLYLAAVALVLRLFGRTDDPLIGFEDRQQNMDDEGGWH